MNKVKRSGSFFNMQFITSSISTMLVLLLLGMVVFFVLSANNLSNYVRENIGFTILMSDDMKEPEALKYQKALNEQSFVKELCARQTNLFFSFAPVKAAGMISDIVNSVSLLQ